MEINLFHILVGGSFLGVAGGILGSFALLRRMALVGDALSHVALPGIALGLIFNFDPFIGALLLLLFGTTLIWAVEHHTRLPVDTLIGVLFVSMLAIGTLLTADEHELFDALFGNITQLSFFDFVITLAITGFVLFILVAFSKKLSLALISNELATAAGFNPHYIEFLFLTTFALLVAVGIKFTGVLLIGALVIIPAAISRNIAQSMKEYLLYSASLGALGAVVGILVSRFYGLAPGPTFVLFLSPLFFISVFLRKER